MSTIDKLNHLVQQGVGHLRKLPGQVLECLPQSKDQVSLGQPDGRDQDVLRMRELSRPDRMEMRPMTAREEQVQRDREFFQAQRGQLSDGQNWAQRGRDGQLHLREHSSPAADMMMAIDRTTRVEAAPLHYMAGELQGGAETLKDTARLAKTVAQPFTTLQSLVESDAGKALDHFRQNSAQITVDAVHQAGSDFLEAQSDHRRGGRASGGLLANVAIGCAPMPVPSRLFRLRPMAELAAEVPKGVPNPGSYPMKIWRFHPEHTRPTGALGGKPEGVMEKITEKCAETKRSLIRQRESAELMASQGYRVKHLPNTKGPSGVKKPDFTVEGKIFDNYAPSSDKPRHLAKEIGKKVASGQCRRAIVSLDDCPISIEAFQQQLNTWPIENLQEVITIRQGKIQSIYP